MNQLKPNHTVILGSLIGTAVGDAIGLPMEGLSRVKAQRRCAGGLRHGLIFGRGMFSDDTEHTLMVANAMLRHPNDAAAFQRSLGWALRWWLLPLPAGVGLSTAKAILRLWMGFPANRAGVRSAGNGAAMRSGIVGAALAHDPEKRRAFTLAACRLTHTDPRAEESAVLVAEATVLAGAKAELSVILEALRPLVTSNEMKSRWEQLERALVNQLSVLDYAEQIGCEGGVSGFAPNSVAVALFAWLRHRGNFAETLSAVISCGGDTDSVAAIAGGICGADVGMEGIPQSWIDGICDWPRSTRYIHSMAAAFAEGSAAAPSLPLSCITVPLRNALFLAIVLMHGVRRLIPL